jgi:HEAT repeat protein
MLLVQDTVPRVRMAAIKSIARIEGAHARAVLKDRLHDEDDAVRATAGGALLTVVVAKP